MSSQNYTKTDFWGNVRYPEADCKELYPITKPQLPTNDKDELEDGELLLFKNSIFTELMLFEQELVEQKK